MEFQPIRGYEDYTIGKDGTIKNKQGRILKFRFDKYGYARVNLQKDKKKITERVHRLVMVAFNPIPNANNMTVDHVDGDVKNNNISNLRWVYLGENSNLQQIRNTDELIFFIEELKKMYSKEDLSEILKTLLNLARLLKQTPTKGE